MAYDDAVKAANLKKKSADKDTASVVDDPAAGGGTATPTPQPSPPSTTTQPDEPLPPLNFDNDAKAQKQLDAIAMFEAGLESDGTEVDPMFVLVPVGKGGRLRSKGALGTGGGRGVQGGNGRGDGVASLGEINYDVAGIEGLDAEEAAHWANRQRRATDAIEAAAAVMEDVGERTPEVGRNGLVGGSSGNRNGELFQRDI